MKKKFLTVILAAMIIASGTGCGSHGDKEEENSQIEQNNEVNKDDSAQNIDYTQISQSEIESLADNEFYAANASGVDITDVYVAVSGAGDWGESLISSPITNESKVKLVVNNLNPDSLYDVCVVDADSNTTEYYNFDIKSTVQITFYADAQCDVSTI